MSSVKSSPAKSNPALGVWRVLVVDDHELFRDGLAELISTEPDIAVCGEAGTVTEALEKFRALQPQLVIVDIALAKGNGLDLVERIKGLDPAVIVLVLSMFDEGVYADRA